MKLIATSRFNLSDGILHMVTAGNYYKYVGNDIFGKPRFEQFDLREEHLKQMETNFTAMRAKNANFDLPVNVDHENLRRGGLKDVFMTEKSLRGRIVLEDNEVKQDFKKNRYASASIEFMTHHPDENGNDQGYTLLGVALTNYPVVSGLDHPVIFSYNDLAQFSALRSKKMSDVLDLLGLKDATEAEIAKFVNDVKAALTTIEDVKGKMSTLETENVRLKANAEVAKFTVPFGKKLLPKDAPKYAELYMKDPLLFASIVGSLPDILVTEQLGLEGSNGCPVGTNKEKLAFYVDEILKQLGGKPDVSTLSYAYRKACIEHPEVAQAESKRG